MAKWDLSKTTKQTDDGRPCNTDLFLVHVMEHEDDHWDLRDRIKDWIEGDWDGALQGLPKMRL